MKRPQRENKTSDRKSKRTLFWFFFSPSKSEHRAAYRLKLPFVEALNNIYNLNSVEVTQQARAGAVSPALKLVMQGSPYGEFWGK